MVVAGNAQHAAMLVAAERVGDPQGIGGAVHAGPLAIPHAEYAIDSGAWIEVELLRARQHGDREVLVQARLEVHAGRFEQLGAAPKLLVQPAQR